MLSRPTPNSRTCIWLLSSQLPVASLRAVQITQFGGPEVLSLVDVPRPTPISTELLVEVHAAGVNPVDWKTRRGRGVSKWAGEPPFGLGWDVAGVVADAG